MNKKIKRILYYLPKTTITKLRYKYVTGKKLDLKNPKDYNQKVLYLMLKECNNYSQYADKYRVREYVKSLGLENILTKVYKIYNSVDEIRFDELPDTYVLKANHGSGGVIIKRRKETIDIGKSKAILAASMKSNFGKDNLEYHYANIKPCIMCEEYLAEKDYVAPIDYKISCFNGKAHCVLVCKGRFKDTTKQYYDLNWNRYNCLIKETNEEFSKPENFEKMIDIAEKLAKPFKFVRVDLYNIDGKIYFGELTFTPRGGININVKQEYLDLWGEMIKL